MARKSSNTEVTTDVEEELITTEVTISDDSDTFNVSKKVEVINLAQWNCGFPSYIGRGDINFEPSVLNEDRFRLSKLLISREELIDQVSANNKLICGLDNNGSHATLYINDKETREYLGFETKDRPQMVITDNKIKSWFKVDNINEFKEVILENVITRCEKFYLLSAIKRLKFNSYDKVVFCENYCKKNNGF